MTLYSIEKAMKSQFTWTHSAFKKFQTNTKDERYASLGLLIFIALATSYGIDKTEIIDYACIECAEYDAKLDLFNNLWSEILIRKEQGSLYLNRDFTDRVYSKIKLTLNALNSQFAGQTPYCKLHL